MANGYTAWKGNLAWSQDIPHYYGNQVRGLFIAMAVLSFVAMPIWGSLLPFSILLQVSAGLLLILLAGFTSARNARLMIVNATVAAVSVVLLEYYAIILRQTDSFSLFVCREISVVIMCAALYYSVKTARAMMSGKIGHLDSPLEFEELVIEEEPVMPQTVLEDEPAAHHSTEEYL